MRYRSLGLALMVLLLAALPVAVASSHQLSSPDATDVPERTVELQGNSYTLTSAIHAEPGNTITVNVAEPDDVDRVMLYDSDQRVADSKRLNGDSSLTFDLSGYEPGTYAVTTYQDGDYTDVMPVLVSGYDVSTDAPEGPDSDEAFDVTVDVTETAASSAPANVQVIVAGDGTRETVDASGSEGTYTGTIGADTLSPGDYTVYSVVQGDEEAFGQQEILAMDEGQSLTVASASDRGDETEVDNTDGPDSDPTESESETDTESTDSNSSDGENDPNGSDSVDDEDSSTTTTETTTEAPTETTAETVSETATATKTDDGVITPGEETPTESTGASGPGFTPGAAAIAVGLLTVVALRRS